MDEKGNLQARKEDVGKIIGQVVSKPKRWRNNPLDAFFGPASSPNAADITAFDNATATTQKALEMA